MFILLAIRVMMPPLLAIHAHTPLHWSSSRYSTKTLNCIILYILRLFILLLPFASFCAVLCFASSKQCSIDGNDELMDQEGRPVEYPT